MLLVLTHTFNNHVNQLLIYPPIQLCLTHVSLHYHVKLNIFFKPKSLLRRSFLSSKCVPKFFLHFNKNQWCYYCKTVCISLSVVICIYVYTLHIYVYACTYIYIIPQNIFLPTKCCYLTIFLFTRNVSKNNQFGTKCHYLIVFMI